MELVSVFSCIRKIKQFNQRDLLHRGDADDLQKFPKRWTEVQALFAQSLLANMHIESTKSAPEHR
jgi:hypothetical protein